MALNSSEIDIRDHRREAVARLRLKGNTQREICIKLAEEGIVNPETDEPWTVGTICTDLKALEKIWKQNAINHIAEKKGQMFAEYEEIKRVAWKEKDFNAILRACKQQCELLGLNAPEKQELSTDEDGIKIIIEHEKP